MPLLPSSVCSNSRIGKGEEQEANTKHSKQAHSSVFGTSLPAPPTTGPAHHSPTHPERSIEVAGDGFLSSRLWCPGHSIPIQHEGHLEVGAVEGGVGSHTVLQLREGRRERVVMQY